MDRDWTGNTRSAHATIGARNYAKEEREENDYYATDPVAVKLLLELETFSPDVWECACGEKHMSNVLEEHGYNVRNSDLFLRGGYNIEKLDFLKATKADVDVPRDIITNPPYKYAKEFVEKALELVEPGGKVAMFLKLTFLEGKTRRELFEKYPPKVVYVSSSRLRCAMNGDFKRYANSNAVAYAWYIWEKGYTGNTVLKWFN